LSSIGTRSSEGDVVDAVAREPIVHKIACLLVSAVCVVSSAAGAAAQQKDTVGCKDHPLFTRMPTYWIHHCSEKAFDRYSFKTGAHATQDVEGRVWTLAYYPQATAKVKPSELQIQRNFEAAAANIGGTVVARDRSRITFKLAKDGKEFWIELVTEFTGKYFLTIVEKGGMAQDIVASAEVFSNELTATGHAAVYGIHFDTGKSDIKPESAQAIAEVARLLSANSSLKVYVVGHTDNVGALEANMMLSQARAEAVVQALVRSHAVAASRLKSYGNGPYAPVASNDTDAGRAKNRRVELVKQ
jgi:OOP family OmpA-OmpF porin